MPSLEHLLAHVVEKHSPKHWNQRTPESISDALIIAMSERKPVSGVVSADEALMKFTRAVEKDDELKDALLTVARKALALFPNEVEAETEKEAS